MVTDQNNPAVSAKVWNPKWITRSPMFAPLTGVATRLPQPNWPDIDALNRLLTDSDRPVVNANGKPVRFVAQDGKPACFEEEFEPRTFLRAEVLVRPENWHDLFNALVWMRFPSTKAAINARHFALLRARQNGQRAPASDALTHFDEDGAVVISSNEQLLELLRNFRWKELFWDYRDAVHDEMRFLLVGHAMYEKALHPFIGMTAKSVLLHVPRAILELENGELCEQVDKRLAVYVGGSYRLTSGKSLAPLPVLGVPGWWPDNETGDFYDDASYFRPGRLGGRPLESSSIS